MKQLFTYLLPFIINLSCSKETTVKEHIPAPVVILLGAPGSGKGSQAAIISKQLGLCHISVGDLFRANIEQKTELGLIAKSYTEKGELVPSEIVNHMIIQRTEQKDCKKGYILDGSCRTLDQTEYWISHLQKSSTPIAFYINVPDEKIVERLSGRLICSSCSTPFHTAFHPPKEDGVCDLCSATLYQRNDDSSDVIANRLNIFHENFDAIQERFKKEKLLYVIDGDREQDQIAGEMIAVFKAFMRPSVSQDSTDDTLPRDKKEELGQSR